MNYDFVTLSQGITTLNVPGLDIKDVSGVDDWDGRKPVLFPRSPDFLTNHNFVVQSFGAAAALAGEITYNLNYQLLYEKLGAGFSIGTVKAGLLNLIGVLFRQVIATDPFAGTVSFLPAGFSGEGIYTDPAGNQAWGCIVTFQIKEFYN